MRIGLMWQSLSKTDPLDKEIAAAVECYIKKYGHTPNLVEVHPSRLSAGGNGGAPALEHITITPNRSVQPILLWIGVGEAVEKGATP